jgi:hypothetical protein
VLTQSSELSLTLSLPVSEMSRYAVLTVDFGELDKDGMLIVTGLPLGMKHLYFLSLPSEGSSINNPKWQTLSCTPT